MIDVKFFASLRDQLGTEGIQVAGSAINANAAISASALRDYLLAEYPAWQHALGAPNVLIAVNQTMAQPETPVQDGDEVAFFPPVTGG